MNTERTSSENYRQHHFPIPRHVVLRRRRERAAAKAVVKLRRKCARKGKPFTEAKAERAYSITLEKGMRRDAARRRA